VYSLTKKNRPLRFSRNSDGAVGRWMNLELNFPGSTPGVCFLIFVSSSLVRLKIIIIIIIMKKKKIHDLSLNSCYYRYQRFVMQTRQKGQFWFTLTRSSSLYPLWTDATAGVKPLPLLVSSRLVSSRRFLSRCLLSRLVLSAYPSFQIFPVFSFMTHVINKAAHEHCVGQAWFDENGGSG